MKRPLKSRDVRPQLDENGLRELAAEMRDKDQQSLRVRKSKLGVKSLSFLADFRHIRYLTIEEISNGIQAVSHLDELRYLFLNRQKSLNLKFLKDLSSSLEDLHIGGSQCKGAAAIAELKGLRSLTIDRVKGIESFDFLNHLERLEYLHLEKIPDLAIFPDLDKAVALRFVSVTTAHSLTDLRGLTKAPNLEIALIQDTPQLPPENLSAFLDHPQLKFIYPCLDFDGEAAVNQQAEEILAPRFGTGLLDAEIPDFSFR